VAEQLRWPYEAPEAATPVGRGERATFSIVIPAYQAAAFVLEAVESALDQTEPPHEVIVVDDGSTDDTVGALEPVRDRIVIFQRPHGGLSAAKNYGLERATGDFVSFLDADDVFYPQRLEAIAWLSEQRPDLDILTTEVWVTSRSDGKRLRKFNFEGNAFAVRDQELEILRRCFVFANAAVRRESLVTLGGFDLSLPRANDWAAWIRLLRAGSRVGTVTTPLGEYRQTPGSLTSNRAESLLDRVAVLKKILRDAQPGTPEHVIITEHLQTVTRRTQRELAKAALRRGAKLGDRLRAAKRALGLTLGRSV